MLHLSDLVETHWLVTQRQAEFVVGQIYDIGGDLFFSCSALEPEGSRVTSDRRERIVRGFFLLLSGKLASYELRDRGIKL